MGIYDRDYYRDEQRGPGFHLSGQRSMVVTLILINVAIFLADVILFGQSHRLSETMAFRVGSLTEPWNWWQLLTAGFAHSPDNFFHVAGNMLMLFFFGRSIEQKYGRTEFLCFYLLAIVFSSLAWGVFSLLRGAPPQYGCYGASGAVSAVLILFAVNYPRQTVLLFLVIPMPAWVAGILWVAYDSLGAINADSRIAHSAHLAGFAFAALYYFGGVRFQSLLPGRLGFSSLGKTFKRRPKLRVHDPEDRHRKVDDQADRILDKLHREGEASLSDKERRILKEYSQRMQQKHR